MPKKLKSLSEDENRIYRNKQRKENYKQTSLYGYNYWTEDALEMVTERKMPDRELSKIIHHSVEAIQKKRYQLKLEEEKSKNN